MKEKRRRQEAFTLIELMLAMAIAALVMGSVFSAMQAGLNAYKQGQESMELYQSARIGLRKVSEELRFALSANAFWRPVDDYKDERFNDFLQRKAMNNAAFVAERDPGAIRFQGDSHSVLFVRKVYQLGLKPPFDLQECRIYAAADGRLMLEIVRSLLEIKQASWFFQYVFSANLSGQVISDGGRPLRFREITNPEEIPLLNFIGNRGVKNQASAICEGVKSISFRYTDGERWENSWDSQQVVTNYRVSNQSPNFNPDKDVMMREKGPPAIVEILLELENRDILSTTTDIPSGTMQGGMLIDSRPPAPAANPAAQPPKSPTNETPSAAPRS
ncbi:MAG: prepilin-type N-terminal cleavage/methylation domain-containing protein [Candidatus Omnitrophota bacterium]